MTCLTCKTLPVNCWWDNSPCDQFKLTNRDKLSSYESFFEMAEQDSAREDAVDVRSGKKVIITRILIEFYITKETSITLLSEQKKIQATQFKKPHYFDLLLLLVRILVGSCFL